MFRSLRLQIYALAFVPFIIVALVGLVLQLRSINSFGEDISALVEESVLDIEKNRLLTLMDSVNGLLAPYTSQPGKEGYEAGLDMLRHMTFDDGVGYIFGYTGNGTRVLMGNLDANIGGNYWDLQDKQGQYIVRDLIDIGKRGGGFYTYWFPKPNETEPSPKYSYAIYIQKWDLMVGTGFYINSLDVVLGDIDKSMASSRTSNIGSSVFVTALIAVGVALAVSFAIKMIYGSLQNLMSSVKALAKGEGDLTQTIAESPIDTLDDIATDFNSFLGAMASDVRSIKGTSSTLSDMATQSTSRQRELENSSDQQKQETIQVSTAVEEMAATASEIANSAEITRTSAESADHEMQNVLSQVQSSSQRMDELNSLLQGVENSVQELGGNVESINSVLSVIQGISEQTNLLALNAAIEAARAGEQGRGFAVVADEVRSLAQRSQQSTVEISEILQSLKDSAERTIKDMDESSEKRTAVIEAMGAIRELIDSTTDSIKQLTEMNVQVATSATEQSAVAREIAQSVTGIASLAENIGKGSSISRQKFEELESLAQELNQVADKFKVD